MRLCPIERRVVQGPGVEAVVDVAVKSQYRLARVFRSGCGAPRLVARHIEAGQGVAQIHELRNLRRGVGAQHFDKLLRLLNEQRIRVRLAAQRGLVVKRLGGG